MKSVRIMAVRISFVIALVVLAAAPGCAGEQAVRPSALWSVKEHRELPAMPLALNFLGDGTEGHGSGVLVHDRIILTAMHIVPRQSRQVVVGTADGHVQVASIDRVQIGGVRPAHGGDWALVVLDRPIGTGGIVPARLPSGKIEPGVGVELLIAGLPFASEEESIFDRVPLVIRSERIEPPPGLPDEKEIFFVRSTGVRDRYLGASGGPVFGVERGEMVLVGIYLGTAGRRILGFDWEREVIVHALPLEEIRQAIAAAD